MRRWDLEDLSAERGLDVSYETIRRWMTESDTAAQPVLNR
jgi:transposase-like protein